MAEQRDDFGRPAHYDDTQHPDNPPNSLLTRPARRAAVWSYLGPIIVLFVVIAIGLIYWQRREASPRSPATEQTYAVGTTGGAAENGYKPGSTPGGSDPQDIVRRPGTTSAELQRRGVDGRSEGPNAALYGNAPLTGLDAVLQKPKDVSGRAVDVRNVTVDSARGNSFWVRDGEMKVEVIAPAGTATLKQGMRVHVVGTVEDDGTGRSRIRASRVDVNR